jgi:hypothetical protein
MQRKGKKTQMPGVVFPIKKSVTIHVFFSYIGINIFVLFTSSWQNLGEI